MLSVVIATRDRHAMLRGAIAAVERQTLDADRFELIVVDNSSNRQAQAAFIAALSVDCRCDYAVEDLPGLARARNIGTTLARGDLVAFLDDDAVADPGWAAAVVARFDADPGIGVIGGPVEPIWPAPRPPWLPAWADAYLSVLDRGTEPHPVGPGDWLVGANLAFRKTVLQAVGGFPEGLGRRGEVLLSNEDLAAVDAAVAAGHVAFYEPRMHVRHHIQPERLSQDWLRRRMAWQVVSNLLQAGGEGAGREPADLATLRGLLGDGDRQGDIADLLSACEGPEAMATQIRAVRLLLHLLLAAPQPSAGQ